MDEALMMSSSDNDWDARKSPKCKPYFGKSVFKDVERCFGILKKRFLHFGSRSSPTTSTPRIVARCGGLRRGGNAATNRGSARGNDMRATPGTEVKKTLQIKMTRSLTALAASMPRRRRSLIQYKKSGGHMPAMRETMTATALCIARALRTKWKCNVSTLAPPRQPRLPPCKPSWSSASNRRVSGSSSVPAYPAERELVWREGQRTGRWACRAVMLTVAEEPALVKARNAERVQQASRRDLELPLLSRR